MNNTDTSNRELPEGVKREHLRVHETARDYTKTAARDNGKTMSQQLNDWFPENWEDVEFGYDSDAVVHMKVTPDSKARVKSMTGKNVSQGDVVTLFVLLGALENGDLDVAHEMMESVPELVWDLLNGFSENIMQGVDVDE